MQKKNFCPYCGAKLSSEVRFCPQCGKKLEDDSINNSEEVSQEESIGENIPEQHSSGEIVSDNTPKKQNEGNEITEEFPDGLDENPSGIKKSKTPVFIKSIIGIVVAGLLFGLGYKLFDVVDNKKAQKQAETKVTMIGGILPPLCTIISQKIMNGLQERRDLHTLLFLVIVYVGIDLFQTLLGYLVIYYKYKFAQGYNLHFNQKVLQKAAGLNLKSYENSEIYDMISRAQYEIEGKLIVYFESFIGIFSSMITTVSYLLIIIRFRIWIVPCIILVPIVKFLINRAINSETFAVIRARTNDSRKCWYIQHVLTYGEAYKELKIYNLFQYFIDKHFEYNKRFNEENLKLKKKSTVQLGGTTIIETFIDGVIFVYIIFAGYLGEIMIGNVVTYMKTITQVKSQIMSVLQSFSDMNQESMFIDQLKEYLDLPEEDIEKEDEQIEITRIENIEIKHLYYRYKEDQQYMLKDVNFFIDGTKTIAIVGQNGSGKTTLLKIIMGFYTDYEGEVFINGIEMRKINKTSIIDYTKRIVIIIKNMKL